MSSLAFEMEKTKLKTKQTFMYISYLKNVVCAAQGQVWVHGPEASGVYVEVHSLCCHKGL